MFNRCVRLSRWSCAAIALGLFLLNGSLSYGQNRAVFRGTPGPTVGSLPTLAGMPGVSHASLNNNGTMQVSINPQKGLAPNVSPYAYIASLPLGDRLPLNGIFADPQMTPQTINGQAFNQNLLQIQQTQLFGNPLGPVGTLLSLGLENQPGAPGQSLTPLSTIGWGGRRPGYSWLGAGMAAGMGYNPYMGYSPFMGQGMGYSPYMGQGMMGYNPFMGQGLMSNPYMGMGMGYNPAIALNPYLLGMMGMMGMGNAGYNLNFNPNNGAGLFPPPGLLDNPANQPNGNQNPTGFGKGLGGP